MLFELCCPPYAIVSLFRRRSLDRMGARFERRGDPLQLLEHGVLITASHSLLCIYSCANLKSVLYPRIVHSTLQLRSQTHIQYLCDGHETRLRRHHRAGNDAIRVSLGVIDFAVRYAQVFMITRADDAVGYRTAKQLFEMGATVVRLLTTYKSLHKYACM
jgi:hypothetical protein